jgi:hypothetical protein
VDLDHQKLKLLFEYLHPPKAYLAVFINLGLVVQADPLYSSVAPVGPGGVAPPNAKAAV